jgi:predicted GIY-YIG superfamily endonuclease
MRRFKTSYRRRKGTIRGTVYLIHFSKPYKGVRHYIGFTQNLRNRLAAHKSGRGSPLLKAAHDAGSRFTVARKWHKKTGDFESQLKAQRNHARFCPKCH